MVREIAAMRQELLADIKEMLDEKLGSDPKGNSK
jgi:hypothetical protein